MRKPFRRCFKCGKSVKRDFGKLKNDKKFYSHVSQCPGIEAKLVDDYLTDLAARVRATLGEKKLLGVWRAAWDTRPLTADLGV